MARPKYWTDERLRAELGAALEKLVGRCQSSKGIARKLRAEGIKGEMRKACGCPIAIWLKRHAKLPEKARRTIVVHGMEVTARPAGGNLAVVTAPWQISVFVEKFDRGEYPALSRTPIRR